jgi:hypothetical protein
MRRSLWLVTMLAPLLPIAATADSTKDKYGQYFCLVEHVAGVLFDQDGRVSSGIGGISIPDEDMKFFITVGPKTYNDIERQVCANDIHYWFEQVFQKGLPYPDHGPNADDRQWVGRNCFASEEITWRSFDGKTNWTFRGYGLFEYYGWSPDTWFEFFQDTGHTFKMGFFYNGPVIEYGHCTKIEPPK